MQLKRNRTLFKVEIILGSCQLGDKLNLAQISYYVQADIVVARYVPILFVWGGVGCLSLLFLFLSAYGCLPFEGG